MSEYSSGPLGVAGPSAEHVERNVRHYAGDYAITDATGKLILGEAFRVVGVGIDAPAEANARLWAVAPKLLAALKGALDEFDNGFVGYADPNRTWVVSAREAIAEATNQ